MAFHLFYFDIASVIDGYYISLVIGGISMDWLGYLGKSIKTCIKQKSSLKLSLILKLQSHYFLLKLEVSSSTLTLLQQIAQRVTIYSEDIVEPISTLKQLSILAVLQGLLNSWTKQAYLRCTFPFWKCPGWGTDMTTPILKGTLWP